VIVAWSGCRLAALSAVIPQAIEMAEGEGHSATPNEPCYCWLFRPHLTGTCTTVVDHGKVFGASRSAGRFALAARRFTSTEKRSAEGVGAEQCAAAGHSRPLLACKEGSQPPPCDRRARRYGVAHADGPALRACYGPHFLCCGEVASGRCRAVPWANPPPSRGLREPQRPRLEGVTGILSPDQVREC
jgi:hypothetical protein